MLVRKIPKFPLNIAFCQLLDFLPQVLTRKCSVTRKMFHFCNKL
nr:unnamed protein product [Callosobruchus analis]